MFSLSTKARAAYLKTGVTDLRLSYEGLFALARTLLHDDPRCGDLFVFCNRQKTRIKILRFDGSGLWVCAKRLEKSTFSWPQQGDMRRPVELVQLQALLEGYELTAKRIWFNRE